MLTFFNKTVIIAALIVLIISMVIYTIIFKDNLKDCNSFVYNPNV